MIDPRFKTPDTDSDAWIRLTDSMVMVTVGNVDGRVALDKLIIDPGSVLEPVRHDHTDEVLYIEEGELEFFLDGETFTLRAGDGVTVPHGASHGSMNKSGNRVVMLGVNAPAFRSPDDDMVPTGDEME